MRIAVFDAHRYDREGFDHANLAFGHELVYFEPRLTATTASLAQGFPAVCSFVNDRVDAEALASLKAGGTGIIALRSAGFNQVDLVAAKALGITVVRVPEYSPHAVAEHAIALLLSLNRKIHRAYGRVREANFSLEGLVGFDLFNKTVGVIGTGKIGTVTAKILHGFGCHILAFDLMQNERLVHDYGVKYVPLDELYARSDAILLHAPLVPETRHLLNDTAFAQIKPGCLIVNTSRGGLIDTKALIHALKQNRIGGAGLDVYEVEEGVFFSDLSEEVLHDDVLARLLTFPNVLITSHQGFLTHEALNNIAKTTLSNVSAFERGEPLVNQVEFKG